MTTTQFSPKMRVAYIPGHAHGDINHEDVERGTVSSVNDKFVFVKFDRQLRMFGWDGATSQACLPGDLVVQENQPQVPQPYPNGRWTC